MDRLTEYSREVKAAMEELAPEWEQRFSQEEHALGSIEFVLRPLREDLPEIVLTTADDELTFQWGRGELHMTYPGEGVPARDSVQEALRLVSEIQAEQWILVEGKTGRWFGKFWGMIPLSEFEDLRSKGRLSKAASWRGSYAI